MCLIGKFIEKIDFLYFVAVDGESWFAWDRCSTVSIQKSQIHIDVSLFVSIVSQIECQNYANAIIKLDISFAFQIVFLFYWTKLVDIQFLSKLFYLH